MQKTNGDLNKSLALLTAQNTQIQNALNAAKEHSRQLEKQLEEARQSNGKGSFTKAAILIAISVLAAVIIFLIASSHS